MLKLTDEIGRGKERTCFLHPHDDSKVVKVVHAPICKQMDREIRVYQQLTKRADISYTHIPKYHGEVATDQGTGYIFDLVKNSDGSASKTLHSFLQEGTALSELHPKLDELRDYLLEHTIIFCNDMSYDGNILVNVASDGTTKLMVIDGLGDVNYIQLTNRINFFIKRKIQRRWDRLMQRLEKFEANCKA